MGRTAPMHPEGPLTAFRVQGEAVPPASPIAFDVTRLATRLAHPTPTGIDRVDLAYARWLLTAGEGRFAVVSSPLGPRVLRRSGAAALLRALDARWSDAAPASSDPAFRAAAPRLGIPVDPTSEVARPAPPPFGLQAAMLAGSRGGGALPHGTVYLHSSHLRLDRPERFAWLSRRPDVRAVFFVHDLIPIAHPEFSRPGEDGRHRARLDTVARHGRGVVVNSAEVGRGLIAHWAGRGTPAPPVTVAPLGVEAPFLRPSAGGLAPEPFFLVCGTIEPRKNHYLLLQAWRRLAEAGGPVPKLVVAGRRGWESEAVIDVLERAPFVRDHVIEAAGLSTPALAELMGRARGLLMPSFAEGYGLPVAEALSLGTPVVASDIAVHREVAGDRALFVDPLDGPGWIRAVRALAAGPPPRPGAPYRAPTWAAHLRLVAAALSAAAA